jgi:hypothetical protein
MTYVTQVSIPVFSLSGISLASGNLMAESFTFEAFKLPVSTLIKIVPTPATLATLADSSGTASKINLFKEKLRHTN